MAKEKPRHTLHVAAIVLLVVVAALYIAHRERHVESVPQEVQDAQSNLRGL